MPLVAYTLILITIIAGYTWVVDPLVEVRGFWRQMPTALVLSVCILHAFRTREWGLAPRAFRPALARALVMTIPAAAAMYVIGGVLDSRPARDRLWLDFLYLMFWGAGQQFALQTVVLYEAQRFAGRGAIPLAAAVFGALHLPNPFLAGVTAAGALCWCWIYDRYPNILPLALSHALLTLAILLSFDDRITGALRVGAAYLSR